MPLRKRSPKRPPKRSRLGPYKAYYDVDRGLKKPKSTVRYHESKELQHSEPPLALPSARSEETQTPEGPHVAGPSTRWEDRESPRGPHEAGPSTRHDDNMSQGSSDHSDETNARGIFPPVDSSGTDSDTSSDSDSEPQVSSRPSHTDLTSKNYRDIDPKNLLDYPSHESSDSDLDTYSTSSNIDSMSSAGGEALMGSATSEQSNNAATISVQKSTEEDERKRAFEKEKRDKWEKKYEWDTTTPVHLKLTKFEIMLEIFHLVMRHGSFKGPLVTDLLKFVDSLFEEDVLPESEYVFRKLFEHSDIINFCFFCSKCDTYFGILKGPVSCRNCREECETKGMNRGSFFIEFSVRQQLEELFEKPGIKVIPRVNRPDDVLSDLMDGSMYRTLCKPGGELSNEHALTVTFNTDGAPVFNSRAGSIWPIQLIVNEISPEQRFDHENTVLCALYFGKKDPNMTYFFNPYLEEFSSLASNGIRRTLPDGSQIVSPVSSLVSVLDLIAKCKCQKMMQCNGRFGCGYCLHPNVIVEQSDDEVDDPNGGRTQQRSKRKERRYISGTTYPYRDPETTLSDMFKAEELREQGNFRPPDDHMNGVKGFSPFCLLPLFNIIFGCVIDYMHNSLAGVCERLTDLILSCVSEERLSALNKILASFTPPQNVLRPPRPLSEKADFKAKEWRACLLFYFLPLFKDEVPQDVFENLSAFVMAIHVLLKKSITREEVAIIARGLLDNFVTCFNKLYGDLNMVHNVHLLTHLVDIVEMWGPLWAYSAFVFESGNGVILKLVNGTSGVLTQIAEKYCLIRSVSKIKEGWMVSRDVNNFCSSILDHKKVERIARPGNGLGLSSAVMDTSLEEKNAFVRAGFPSAANNQTHEYFQRVLLPNAEGNPFYSSVYKKPKVYNDTCVQLVDLSYASCVKFICMPDSDNELFVFVKPIRVLDEEQPLAPHIKTCVADFYGQLNLIKASFIKCKAVLIECKGRNYVIDFPNFYEKL